MSSILNTTHSVRQMGSYHTWSRHCTCAGYFIANPSSVVRQWWYWTVLQTSTAWKDGIQDMLEVDDM